jgi:hypothetical protein
MQDRLTEPAQDGVSFRAERQMNVPPVSTGPSLQHQPEPLETAQSPLHAGHRSDIERVEMLERQTRFEFVLVVTNFDQQATIEDGLYLGESLIQLIQPIQPIQPQSYFLVCSHVRILARRCRIGKSF